MPSTLDAPTITLERAPTRHRASLDFALPLEPVPSHLTHISRRSLHAHFDQNDEECEGDGEGGKEECVREDGPVVDIEHAPVEDDPREWSGGKKNFVLALIIVAVVSSVLVVGSVVGGQGVVRGGWGVPLSVPLSVPRTQSTSGGHSL